ncbi:MAG: DUF1499 domain-containing protein [Alphaproteobacteria bacterium]
MLDFALLELTEKPNQYLVCPADYCQKAAAHREAPVYDVPAAKLRDAWAKVVASQPRTKTLEQDSASLSYEYVQRSALFRYPDFVSVQFVSLGDESTTMAIYSRSKYGYSDLGVNKKRIDTWLDLLEAELSSK